MDINEALALIDEWVQELEEDQLNEQCRQSGRSFFQFMQSRGVNAAYMARLIIDVTGYNPAQLWRVEDAALLRDAIFRYEGSEAVTRIQEAQGRGNTARENIERFWDDTN